MPQACIRLAFERHEALTNRTEFSKGKGLVAMKRSVLKIIIGAVLIGGLASACAARSGVANIAADTQPSSAAASTTSSSSPKPVDNLVTVPSLVGLSPEQATASLQSAGLTITVSGETTNPEFKIISQDPAAGARAKKGSDVAVYVGESKNQKLGREQAAASAAAAESAAAAASVAAAAEAADADLSTYQTVDERTWALVTKDPDSHVGEKYVLYGVVTQFDAATGTSTFRASTGPAEQQYSYKYDVNTMVTAAGASQVAEIVKDDLLRMYVKVQGSLSYDTQAGGSTTVPQVSIHSFELLGHDD